MLPSVLSTDLRNPLTCGDTHLKHINAKSTSFHWSCGRVNLRSVASSHDAECFEIQAKVADVYRKSKKNHFILRQRISFLNIYLI